jgi:FtsP/CotA-like multicopper oxidase with cupredoxin domain
MKVNDMKQIQPGSFKQKPLAAAILLALATPFFAQLAHANSAFGAKTDIALNQVDVPTFFASSPSGIQPAYDLAKHRLAINPVTGVTYLTVDTGAPLRKFVDSIGGVANGLEPVAGVDQKTTDLKSGIPVAIAEHNWVNPVSGIVTKDDYFEIAIVEYTEYMHSDLAKETRLRGYVQVETDAMTTGVGLKDPAGIGSEHIEAKYPDGTLITDPSKVTTTNKTGQVYFAHKPHYLGPVIVASRGTPVRMKVTNYLPYSNTSGASVGSWNRTGGDLPIPVDETIPGGGPVLDIAGQQVFAKNADGSAMRDSHNMPIPVKMGQNRASIHWHGGDTPWVSDGTPHQWFAPKGDISYTIGVDPTHPHGMGRGDSAVNVPDMADPGEGSYTLFFPNNLSGRMMFYHDHTSGLTRLNVYQGMAAGYVVVDPLEQAMVATALGTSQGLDTIGIPLVIQDKGFVPKNIGPNAKASDGQTPASQDAKWDLAHWGQEGDLFMPHVYETNQDPNSIDGTNPVGRWDWGPWFWPVFPAQYSLPTGNYGDVSTTPEAFMDTPVVNGKAYPTMTVDPKTYRFRILSAGNDRTLNLGLYQAVDAAGKICDAANRAPTPYATLPYTINNAAQGAPAVCTEVRMVPALPTAGFPANWPVDGRVGGVPDPATAGPDIVQIGSEGGLLPAPAILKSQPVTYETNVRSITVFNVLHHDLLLGGAERADVLIDFTKYAGQTLIVYNDAPAPMPGFDPRIDYYTGMGDNTGAGGAYDVMAGYGPNTRTVMQIKVNATNTSKTGGPLNTAALAAAMPAVYAATQPAPIIPEAAYNAPFATASVNNYAAIGTGSGALNSGLFTYTVPAYVDAKGVTQTKKSLPVINKAIQELFDPIYGRMNATLAVELPFSTATVATTIPLNYIDVPVESMDAIKDGETQIWKITHNGVDDHPVHFHLVNVQVINRVGWDGTIKEPDANELGWKETLRMNPLEDVYVAVKATRPVAPFGVPASSRLLDPSQVAGSTLGFTQIDVTTGQAPAAGQYSNVVTNFDNEYVWHCHILGHEEFDFMRPFVFHPTVVVPDAPALVAVSGSTVSWTDTTPAGGQDAQGIPTAGTNALYPEPISSPKNEIGFKVFNGATLLATLPANVTSWTDATGLLNLTGATVVAYNAAGESAVGTSAGTAAGAITTNGTISAPGVFTISGTVDATGQFVTVSGATGTTGLLVGATVVSKVCNFPMNTTIGSLTPISFTFKAPVTAAVCVDPAMTVTNPSVAPPGLTMAAGPTGLTQTLNADGSVSLNWVAVAGATGYTVLVDGVSFVVQGNRTRYTVPASVLAGATSHTFSVTAQTLNGTTAATPTAAGGAASYTGVAYPPVAVSVVPGTTPGTVTLSWANDPKNVNNVTGLTLGWNFAGSPITRTFAPTTTGATVIRLTPKVSYTFTLVANSANNNGVNLSSPSVTVGTVTAP